MAARHLFDPAAQAFYYQFSTSRLHVPSLSVGGTAIGTAAFATVGTSGATVALLSTANTWGGLQTHTATLTIDLGAPTPSFNAHDRLRLIGLADNNCGIQVISGPASVGYLHFGDADGRLSGTLQYSHALGRMLFNAEALFQFAGAPIYVLDLTATAVTSTSGPIGYGAGAGGTVTQATSKSTAVTLSKPSGQITLNSASLAANAAVAFTLTNTAIGANDTIVVNHKSAGTFGAYLLQGRCAAGSAQIAVRNLTAVALAEAIVLQFTVSKGSTT